MTGVSVKFAGIGERMDQLEPFRADGMAQREAATALGIPKRTVERYIAKALAHCLERVQA